VSCRSERKVAIFVEDFLPTPILDVKLHVLPVTRMQERPGFIAAQVRRRTNM